MPCDSVRAGVSRLAVALFALPILLAACSESSDPIALARERVKLADSLALQLSQAPPSAQAAELAVLQRDAEFSLQEAVTLYRVGRADLSEDAALLVEFAEVALKSGSHDLCAAAYNRAAGLGSDAAQNYLMAGINYTRMNDAGADFAREAFLNCLDHNPTDSVAAAAHAGLARLALRRGLVANARYRIEKALALDTESIAVRLSKGLVDCREGRVIEAADSIAIVNSLPGSDALAFIRDMKQMISELERDGAPFPSDAAHELAYAKLLANTGRSGDALRPLERAVMLNPNDSFAWFMLGSLRLQHGDTTSAKQALDRSLEIEPDQEQARQLLERIDAIQQQ